MLLTLFVITLVLLVQEGTSSPLSRATIASPKTSGEDYRLPTDIRPDHYTIELEPDFETDTFTGSVKIDFTVISATRTFYFHKRELDIDVESFTLQVENSIPITNFAIFECVDDDREYCVLTFADELIVGLKYTLTIGSFKGILNLDNAGFYLAKYQDENGNEV